MTVENKNLHALPVVIEDRVLAILEDRATAPTPEITYLAKRARELRTMGNQLLDQESKTRAQLQSIQHRILEVNGSIQTYREDVQALLEMEDNK